MTRTLTNDSPYQFRDVRHRGVPMRLYTMSLSSARDGLIRRPAAARARPGSGLGLAIVKRTVDDHGGSVTVTNADGGGTLLTLRFDANGR